MAASTTSLLECRLLGPLDIEVGGRRLQMTAPRLRSVLGTLLLRAGETVPVQRLMDCVWEDRPPADPSNQIAVCVSLLRRKLVQAGAAGDLIVTEAPGYRLQTHAVRLDTHQVTQLGKEAAERRAAGEHEAAVGLLGEALSLWRGPLLAGVSRQVWQSDVRAWEEKRVALRDMCTKIQLELGQYEHLISELSSFIQEHPLFERPRAQLMTALYHSGRQADALRVFRETSDLLKAELAVAPGAELQQLHHDILHGTLPPVRRVAAWQDSPAPRGRVAAATPFRASTPSTPGALPTPAALLTPADPVTPGASVARTAPGAAAAPVRATEVAAVSTASMPPTGPCLLPGDIGEFVGREAEIAAIQDILALGTGPVPVVGVVGAGGTGKSTLAVHVAHRLRPAFTGGQLYIDLRGTAARLVSPAEALARLLRELGLAASSIPAEVEERAERYRALLADRRVLIVLDNAAGTEQIRPLLQGKTEQAGEHTAKAPGEQQPTDGAPGGMFGAALRSPVFWTISLAFVGCGVTMSFVDVHLVASLDSHGLGGGTASTTMAILGAAEIVGSLVAGYLCDRGHGLKVLAGCYLIRALSLVVMVVAPTVLTAWVFGLLFGISYLGTVVAGSMYLLNALDLRAKGLALGMMWCLHQVSAFAASEAGGLSFDALHSYDPIVIGAAASAGLSFLIVVLALPKALRKANPTHA
ncbi:MFS transporter [Streptomyces noursei]|uniref:MFS transporter n=1 Tax=Streptomyces noursei TaxID=1971 RepID=UPI001675DF58|nr:MFS transporter [Streptomyces noursei]MCZ1020469.1 MFS transporter [Streptomyces noursei]GGX13573.1 hypothetical protein GCM10010341_38900 [Streptomyces noursei]